MITIIKEGSPEKRFKYFNCIDVDSGCGCVFKADREDYRETFPGFFKCTCPCCGGDAFEFYPPEGEV